MIKDGLIAAAFTPLHPDGSVNPDMIEAFTEKLAGDGLSGIFVCGTNGEGPNLSVEERMEVAERYIRASAGRLRVMVHVGHASIAEARRLAKHAAEAGADAISAVSAFYFKPTTAEGLSECMAAIASAAPETPFYYYHIPMLTGLSITADEFLTSAVATIPSLAGVKYSATTLHDYLNCQAKWKDRYGFFWGVDEMLLPAVAGGITGAIGSTYAFAARLNRNTIDMLERGDIAAARENQSYLTDAVMRVTRYPHIPAQKAVMKMLGWDFGPSRLPLKMLDENQYDALKASLDEIGFLDRIRQGA